MAGKSVSLPNSTSAGLLRSSTRIEAICGQWEWGKVLQNHVYYSHQCCWHSQSVQAVFALRYRIHQMLCMFLSHFVEIPSVLTQLRADAIQMQDANFSSFTRSGAHVYFKPSKDGVKKRLNQRLSSMPTRQTRSWTKRILFKSVRSTRFSFDGNWTLGVSTETLQGGLRYRHSGTAVAQLAQSYLVMCFALSTKYTCDSSHDIYRRRSSIHTHSVRVLRTD